MNTTKPRKSTRQRLLLAAYRVVNRLGPTHLTLDEIATEAGMERGDLLYHFRDREAIIGGLLRQGIENFSRKMRKVRNAKPGSGAFTRAYLLSLSELPSTQVTGSIVCAALQTPELLDPLRDQRERWQVQSEQDDLDAIDATLIRLAADGLWLTELLDISTLRPEMRAAVLQRLELRSHG